MNAINQKELGLYHKFNVTRTDGKDAHEEKHHGDEYFVLNLTTDRHAIPALSAYADSCSADYPVLAADLRAKAPLTSKFAIPGLKEGEKYAFGITLPDGKTTHIILLPIDQSIPSWDAGMELAKNLGVDLPDRAEQALFLKYMPEEFQKDWYWSNTQHASYSDYAWYQDFNNGDQYLNSKSSELRVRPVRREFSD